ncbi:TIGR01244 family sulfur transferase [Marinicauda pacifica]|uniref:TIGR01244 family sulfur transferase n=1 Tax=Marinicauda pacifica TaxID=1133559 RepID=UPI0035C7C6AD
MDLKQISPFFAASPQLSVAEIGMAASQGYKAIINNRPDAEEDGQPSSAEIEAAARAQGLDYRYIPVIGGQIGEADVEAMTAALSDLNGPVLAYCRTGTRSVTLWALSEARHIDADALIRTAAEAGYDISSQRSRLAARLRQPAHAQEDRPRPVEPGARYDVVVIGGGAGGIASAASILKRRPQTRIALIEPRDEHYYQPGWTLVGGGVFRRRETVRAMAGLIPKGVKWIRAAAASFEPDRQAVVLEDGTRLAYSVLVAAPGLKLDWDQVDGLRATLGKNGVTSNYRFDLAPYTWELLRNLRSGTALFTQPPMPIKCAGAPQKAMYLACDAWKRAGALDKIQVEFRNAGGTLFGVGAYVPALMDYVKDYAIDLELNSNLVAIDGPKRTATFKIMSGEREGELVERRFDMIHVCPPQTAPDFVKASPLANEAGWIEVSAETLQHVRYGNVFALGDACSAPNAKTAAAVRAQAPVVAENVISVLDGRTPRRIYNGYGSCPLTVERGKIVLAEFGYGGKLLPTFPSWLVDGTKPSRLAWFLKEKMLPAIYFGAMLKGREWLVTPERLAHTPSGYEAQDALPPRS